MFNFFLMNEKLFTLKFLCKFSFLNKYLNCELNYHDQKIQTNTCAQHTETLESCFDLIRSYQQCIPWSPTLEIEPTTRECRAETLPLSRQFTLHTCDAKPFNSQYDSSTQKKKENVHLYPCPWGYNNYADAYFKSSWEDLALEVTMSSVKITDVTCKTHSDYLAAQFPWLVVWHYLRAMWIGSLVVEFQLRIP